MIDNGFEEEYLRGIYSLKNKYEERAAHACTVEEMQMAVQRKAGIEEAEKTFRDLWGRREEKVCENKSLEPENVMEHSGICAELNDLYRLKNRDYGDSFHKTYLEEGMAMARIRLTDKLERFKKLTREGGQEVKDESIRDTLIDLANYAIMTVMEMDRESAE